MIALMCYTPDSENGLMATARRMRSRHMIWTATHVAPLGQVQSFGVYFQKLVRIRSGSTETEKTGRFSRDKEQV